MGCCRARRVQHHEASPRCVFPPFGPLLFADTLRLSSLPRISRSATPTAAASTVNDEPLTAQYSGILGLALPLDSSIFESIGTEDSQALAANLFSMASSSSAPSAPFLSLALERPGDPAVPSVLGVGLHPHELVPDPSKVEYDDLVSSYNFNQFWAANVKGITVWVQGEAKNVTLGVSSTGAPYPTAVLDSGTPVILASPAIISAIYNTLGISPASDGTCE